MPTPIRTPSPPQAAPRPHWSLGVPRPPQLLLPSPGRRLRHRRSDPWQRRRGPLPRPGRRRLQTVAPPGLRRRVAPSSPERRPLRVLPRDSQEPPAQRRRAPRRPTTPGRPPAAGSHRHRSPAARPSPAARRPPSRACSACSAREQAERIVARTARRHPSRWSGVGATGEVEVVAGCVEIVLATLQPGVPPEEVATGLRS
jgi:hypothetical protein